MRIFRLQQYDDAILADLNQLMQALSEGSCCDETKLRETLQDANSHLIIAMEDERIIGCGTLCVMHTPERRLGSVEAVVVHPDYRGRGVGRKLMEKILDTASSLAPIQLHLTSQPARREANELYRKLGFDQRQTNNYVKMVVKTKDITIF